MRIGTFVAGIALVSTLAVATVSAAPQQIKLRDGSIVRGEVKAMAAGVYTVETKTLGTIKVPADQILSISADEATDSGQANPTPATGIAARTRNTLQTLDSKRQNRAGTPATTPNATAAPSNTNDDNTPSVAHDPRRAQSQVNTKVQSMMMNSNVGSKVMGLQDNTDMQAVLDDPELMNAIQNMDYDTLMKSDKMNQLMNNPEIKDLLGAVNGGQ